MQILKNYRNILKTLIKYNMKKKYIDHLEKCFELAEKNSSNIDEYIINMDGMSGTKTRHFYNNLLKLDDARYLEIGTWKGSSVCSAMVNNRAKILCIDNWSEFNGPKTTFMENFKKYEGNNITNFIEADCFSIDLNNLEKFNIYMYDGNHSYDSHYNALTYYLNVLDDLFIYVVDDWNWADVRNATMNSINDLNLNIVWQKEIKLNNNNTTTEDKLNWWNGISVFLLKKEINEN